MSDNALLIVAMAEKCAEMIEVHGRAADDQPKSLRPAHLERMCREIARRAGEWPATKTHRWLGFVQAGMIANGIMDLDGAKEMFDAAKNAFGAHSQDLLDHLDPESSFSLEIGGRG